MSRLVTQTPPPNALRTRNPCQRARAFAGMRSARQQRMRMRGNKLAIIRHGVRRDWRRHNWEDGSAPTGNNRTPWA